MSNVAETYCVADIVRTAGGQIVGRTRLQKVAYLLQVVGYPSEFPFEYYHYGPYSEELADRARVEDAFDVLVEREEVAGWGGRYSVFFAKGEPSKEFGKFAEFAKTAANGNAIDLELAATAAFLAREERSEDPWNETARRKPEKAVGGHLEAAKTLYEKLMAIETPQPLPRIV